MSIESIKKLIKEGDIPQARTQLREVLAKTPEDAVAQMLYGTCCQITKHHFPLALGAQIWHTKRAGLFRRAGSFPRVPPSRVTCLANGA